MFSLVMPNQTQIQRLQLLRAGTRFTCPILGAANNCKNTCSINGLSPCLFTSRSFVPIPVGRYDSFPFERSYKNIILKAVSLKMSVTDY